MPTKREHCSGCHDEIYHNWNGPGQPCWSFEKMELVMRKEVHVDQRPPWTQKAKLIPSCYHRSRYVYVGKDQTC